jgi:hypothetical protein
LVAFPGKDAKTTCVFTTAYPLFVAKNLMNPAHKVGLIHFSRNQIPENEVSGKGDCGVQELQLVSNLSLFQNKPGLFPLSEQGGSFQNITVFRLGLDDGYKRLDAPYSLPLCLLSPSRGMAQDEVRKKIYAALMVAKGEGFAKIVVNCHFPHEFIYILNTYFPKNFREVVFVVDPEEAERFQERLKANKITLKPWRIIS